MKYYSTKSELKREACIGNMSLEAYPWYIIINAAMLCFRIQLAILTDTYKQNKMR